MAEINNDDKKKKKMVSFFFYSGILIIAFIFVYFMFLREHINRPPAALISELPHSESHKIRDKADEYKEVSAVKLPMLEDDIEDIFNEAVSGEGKNGKGGRGGKQTSAEDEFLRATEENTKMLDRLMNSYAAQAEAAQKRQEEAAASAAGPITITGLTQADPAIEKEREAHREAIAKMEDSLRRLNNEVRLNNIYNKMMGHTNPQIGDTARKERREEGSFSRSSVRPVKKTGRDNIVSSLNTAPRHTGFYGMGGGQSIERNTIRATTYGKQIIESGQNVRVRTSEAMQVGSVIVPAGSILTGVGTVAVDRLYITFTTVTYDGTLLSVNLEAFDADGQRGIYVPGSMEMDALRELGGELANSMANVSNSSMSIIGSTPTAAEELKKDVGKGVVQGVSRFAAKKIARVRVTINDGHNIFVSDHR